MQPPDTELDGSNVRIAIAVARFNEHVTDRLLDGALEAAKTHGAPDPEVHWVPGSFELPVVALHLARSGRFEAVVCLGAVIRHETDHYRYVAEAAATGISRVALDTGIPCLFGVLTCDTDAQALARAGGPGERNAGRDAVEAAIATVNVLIELTRAT
jgi:6,7-dimethyl-8-ribityllumazine synthase